MILGLQQPLYMWYDGYPPHVADSYAGRVSRMDVRNTRHGLASLNMTNITEADDGWYECVVHFLNRKPAVLGNGTWVHLDVHAPPRLVQTPARDVFVNIGDSVTLTCESRGTPQPVVTWLKGDKPVRPSETTRLSEEGNELRIHRIGEEDIGQYTCRATNSEGSVRWTSKIIMAGGAVIVAGPANQTSKASLPAVLNCRTRARPDNVTVLWLRDGQPVGRVAALDGRARVLQNGSLVIDPLAAEDTGRFTCQASNGIGVPQRASAFLDVHYAAHVPYTPSVQYLATGSQGVIRCHIKANPPIQFVTWYRNRRDYDPKNVTGVSLLPNGSLLIDKVSAAHQGTYRCRPFNLYGTGGESGEMQVVVREPPRFVVRPNNLYQRRVQDTIRMPCVVQGSPPPEVTWRRHDNQSLPSDRVVLEEGNITIRLLRKSDFGYYECVARNSVATIVTSTQLVVEGTTTHPPHDITTNASSYAITIRWLPGYSGGDSFDQKYAVWYQQEGTGNWNTYEIKPTGSSYNQVTIYQLLPDTAYELMVAAKNDIGDRMYSDKVTVRTLDVGESAKTDPAVDPKASKKKASDGSGPLPGAPLEVNVTESSGGFLVSWQPPLENPHVPVLYYSVELKPADGEWKPLGERRLTKTRYTVKQLQGGRTYYFKVLAHSHDGWRESETVKYVVPDHVQKKAITAALVGGLLLLIVSIILSVCTVKICNKRKRRKQEKEYNMVACRVTEARSSVSSPVPLNKTLDRGENSSLEHY
ncbi:protein turtle-like [Pollicipes pollicipes]|uniref:protein turtle-like n=1 Tax=Pollicipes pollicipes TaxID=41117 RepID=UPI0018857D9F|nr:protein turtle-like [Pollicipes pollicipes]